MTVAIELDPEWCQLIFSLAGPVDLAEETQQPIQQAFLGEVLVDEDSVVSVLQTLFKYLEQLKF